ncbi:conserved hypothetical protein [Magnetococcus marinus MC-1]|uniref:Bacteriophage-related protein n=1 Tax=Magnetococcus marinus (strain ATCC BAA-1437 / JCM 17883 / MC-1) TaxID=156889 RepID=A0LBC8_MAGMM|nr:hypothetical protein [Magnetococcus marinus]ABK45271.1 conserved hypothetical protein [Magnetococcus marinus MC-1]
MDMTLSQDGTTLHIHIPMRLRRHGGRKMIVTSDGEHIAPSPAPLPSAQLDDPLVRALIKARRWQKQLEEGEIGTIKELAEKEGVDSSLLSRTLRLNALAPDIVNAIMTGTAPNQVSLESLRQTIPHAWEEQRILFGMHT